MISGRMFKPLCQSMGLPAGSNRIEGARDPDEGFAGD
jgi:hypothetical protein